jgi:methylmalonyl-CoA/ethylmalonyl-CoA epimerase
LKAHKIGQVSVPVRDVERATAFYRDVLCLPHLFVAPPGLSFFDCGGTRLMLSRPEKPELDHPASILYYLVEKIEERHDELKRKGVRCVHEPRFLGPMPDHDLWMAFYEDGEGNTFALMEEKAKA